MTKKEAIKIKDEILKKDGTICIGNTIKMPGVVWIKDILDIIDMHTEEK